MRMNRWAGVAVIDLLLGFPEIGHATNQGQAPLGSLPEIHSTSFGTMGPMGMRMMNHPPEANSIG